MVAYYEEYMLHNAPRRALQLSAPHNKLYVPVVNVNKDIATMGGEALHVLDIFKLDRLISFIIQMH